MDIVRDLEAADLPFSTNSVSEIVASHVLEHVQNYVPLMVECWRVLKPGGRLLVKAPHFRSESAFSDPTHVRHFTARSMDFFAPDTVLFRESGWYMSPARFSINRTIEHETEFEFDLRAVKGRLLLVAPPASIHTRRWRDMIRRFGWQVHVAARRMKGLADYTISSGLADREADLDAMVGVLERVLDRYSFDVVHAHFATCYGHVLKSVPSGIRAVLSVWGEDLLAEAVQDARRRRRLVVALARADAVTTTSRNAANVLAETYGFPRGRVFTIPWGFSDAVFRPRESHGVVERTFGIPSSAPLILSARVCRPSNNIERILVAFQRSGVDGVLAILEGARADSAYVEALRQTAARSGNVVFVPAVDETMLASLYNRASATVSIPMVDQLATTVLESLACGTPVIGSDIPAYRERIVHGTNGWLVRHDDVHALAQAMTAAALEGHAMAPSARAAVISDSWEDNAPRMLSVYDAPL